MKPYGRFESKVFEGYEELPVGGYVCKIMKAEEKQNRSSGSRLDIYIDIAEGDYRGFYANAYKSDTREDKKWSGVFRLNIPKEDGSKNDDYAINGFNNFIGCVEESNPGYHWAWDEATLKDKTVCLVFRREEYQKQNCDYAWSVKPFKVITLENCRAEKFGKYDDKPMKNKSAAVSAFSAFTAPALVDDDELPF